MGKYNIQFVANTTQSDAKIKQMSRYLQELNHKVRQTGSTFEYAEEEDINFINSLSELISRATTAKLRVTDMAHAIEELMVFYNRMTDAEKTSPIGDASISSIEKMKKTLETYKTELSSVIGVEKKLKQYVSPEMFTITKKKDYVSPVTQYAIENPYYRKLDKNYDKTLDKTSNKTHNKTHIEVKKEEESEKGLFGSILGGNLAARAVMDSLRELKNVTKEAIQTNMEFEQSNAELSAVLIKSKTEIADLTEQAKHLGATTLFTANEITQLQISLARLGFNQDEIKQSTAAVSQLALATGVDLNDAATLTGSTLRSFGYDASEAARVASVLGVSTTKSALTMEKLKTAMGYASSVARQAGFHIEDVVAMLGKMVDNGQQATTAGVNLRNIFLDLSNKSSKLSQAIKKVTGKEQIRSFDEFVDVLRQMREEGINLDDVANVVQKRVTPGFLNMIANTEGIIKLRDELKGCTGELEEMANKMTDTLQGSITLLKSAWDGLMLSFNSSNSSIKSAVDSLTKLLNSVREMSETGQLKYDLQNISIEIKAITAAFLALKAQSIASAVWGTITTAVTKLNKALQILNATIMRNPYAAAGAAIIALTVAVYNLSKRSREAADSMREAEEASGALCRIAKINAELDSEIRAGYDTHKSLIDYLTNAIHNNTLSLDERRMAIQRLKELVPDYHAELTAEGKLIEKNRDAVNDYIKALEKQIRLKAYENKLGDLFKERAEIGFDPQRKRTRESIEEDLLSGKESIDLSALKGDSRIQFIENYIASTLSSQDIAEKEYNLITEVIKKIENEIRESNLLTAVPIVGNADNGDISKNEGLGLGKKEETKSALSGYEERIAKAEDSYAISLKNATIEVDNGSMKEKEFLDKKLSATQQLYRAYVMVIAEIERELEKNPALKGELSPIIAKLKPLLSVYVKKMEELSGATGKLIDLAEKQAEEEKQLNAKKRLYTKILRGLECYTNQARVGYDAVGITGVQDKINNLTLNETIDFSDIEDKINSYLLNKDFKIRVDLETGSIEKIKNTIEDALNSMQNRLSAFSTFINGFDNIKKSGESLVETLKSDADAWDKMFATINFGIGIMQTIVGMMQAINTLQKLSEALKAKDILLTKAQAVANTEQATAAGNAAGANAAAAAASAGASVAGISILGPALAVASIGMVLAAVLSAISSSKSAGNFAEGGIVPGNSWDGDKLVANVNSGEGILTRQGVKNLGALYAGQALGGVMVQGTSKVTGEEIRIAYNNYAQRKGLKTMLN